MALTKNDMIGDAGEALAEKYLVETGYELFAFGVSRDYASRKKLEATDETAEAFLKINQKISDYIQQCWTDYNKQDPLPYPGPVVFEMMKKDRKEAERMKDANRKALKKTFPAGHPGRYDFIGLKNGQYEAIEIKVNTSRLSYWQKVRLGLLQKHGYPVKVVRVKISKEQQEKILVGEESAHTSIDITETVDTKDVHIPDSL
ncbi:VRR-NUC domain-containing protein [Billgrantia antri]|uniref:VRR-NUC domain-containing protein n=1 Tax=Halomonas sulfidivorans TaxID=2733488 RepID=A0ABX7WJ10_9GAMM|nr:VRR-NUC domain-containing protein [Halomonas sulfidivorans]QTP59567.1 VRR-NUC domain-containing protein [Halomonas sulfidivorans]